MTKRDVVRLGVAVAAVFCLVGAGIGLLLLDNILAGCILVIAGICLFVLNV